MRRAMNLIHEGTPQESYLYDHPYFGQIVLAGVLQLSGFSNNLGSIAAQSPVLLYEIPRLLMGLFAILDTFLIYKIAKKLYGANTGYVASLLFSVMPITWIFRSVLLDSILLPLVLSSVLFALQYRENKKTQFALFSGICLGLALFTKVPVVIFIPLITYLIVFSHKKITSTFSVIVPILSIPLIWPAYALYLEQLDLWIKDVFWQAGREGSGLAYLLHQIILIDPLMLSLGIAGLAYAAYQRNRFVLLWAVPYLIFVSVIGYTQYFHWIIVIPILCIAFSKLFVDLVSKINKTKKTILLVILSSIFVFGFVNTSIVINSDMTSTQFSTMDFVYSNYGNESDVTFLSSPVYSWILIHGYDLSKVPLDYSDVLFYPITTQKIVLVVDQHFKNDFSRGSILETVYNSTKLAHNYTLPHSSDIVSQYPYTNFQIVPESQYVEIRDNFVPGN